MIGRIYWIGLDKRRPCVVVSSSDVLGVDVRQTHVVRPPAGEVVVPGGVGGPRGWVRGRRARR